VPADRRYVNAFTLLHPATLEKSAGIFRFHEGQVVAGREGALVGDS
jgi:hypothetical protein